MSPRPLLFFSVATIVGCSLITDVDGLRSQADAQAPTDGGNADQATVDAGNDASPTDPSWTFTLPAKSLFNAVAVDPSGNVYVAGSLSAPLTLGSISIPSTQGEDVFVMKLDGTTKQPVWAKIFGGTGDDVAKSLVYESGSLLLVGQTTSTTLLFGGTNVVIPASTSSADVYGFLAKVDPTDGSAVWAISPDTMRGAGTSHTTFCSSLAAKGTTIVIACAYNGAKFGYQIAAFDTATNYGLGILRFKDGGISPPQQTWGKSLTPGFINPVVTLDDAGDILVAAGVGGITQVIDQEKSAVAVTGVGTKANLYVLRITDATQVVSSAKAWATDSGGLLPPYFTGITARGTDVVAVGQLFGTGSFGKTPLTSAGGFDGLLLRLNSALDTQAQFAYGGASFDTVAGVATDGKGNSYIGMNWSSTGISLAATKTLPAPPAGSPNLACALGKIDAAGKVTTLPAMTSQSATVRFLDVKLDATSKIYAVGTFGGATTFDDGSTVTATLTGSGFLLRRAPF